MRIVTVHAFVLLLVFVATETRFWGTNSCRGVETKGCSVPTLLRSMIKKVFGPACRKHSVCYACGSWYGWRRAKCDKAFRRDMKSLCRRRTRGGYGIPISRSLCIKSAKFYYRAYAKFGQADYKMISPGWCYSKCAKKYGKPNRKLRG